MKATGAQKKAVNVIMQLESAIESIRELEAVAAKDFSGVIHSIKGSICLIDIVMDLTKASMDIAKKVTEKK